MSRRCAGRGHLSRKTPAQFLVNVTPPLGGRASQPGTTARPTTRRPRTADLALCLRDSSVVSHLSRGQASTVPGPAAHGARALTMYVKSITHILYLSVSTVDVLSVTPSDADGSVVGRGTVCVSCASCRAAVGLLAVARKAMGPWLRYMSLRTGTHACAATHLPKHYLADRN